MSTVTKNTSRNYFQTVNDDNILVKWADDHQSTYSYEWLQSRSFSKESQNFYMQNIYQPSRILWDKGEFKDVFHSYDYKEITTK